MEVNESPNLRIALKDFPATLLGRCYCNLLQTKVTYHALACQQIEDLSVRVSAIQEYLVCYGHLINGYSA